MNRASPEGTWQANILKQSMSGSGQCLDGGFPGASLESHGKRKDANNRKKKQCGNLISLHSSGVFDKLTSLDACLRLQVFATSLSCLI